VTKALSDLQLEHAHLLSTHGETSASLRASESSLSQALAHISDLESDLAKASSQISKVKERLSRDESEKKLLDREVKFLKGMLASYQSENQDEDGMQRNSEQEERFRQLEEVIEGYKRTIDALRAKVDSDAKDPRDAKIEELSSGMTLSFMILCADF
jgi:mitotic spindle assembly checkpoint protein MAD1